MDSVRVLLVGNAKSIHIRRWAAGLAGLGVEVVLLSKTPFAAPGIEFVHDEPAPLRPWRPLRWSARRRRFHAALVRRIRPDVVHVQNVQEEAVYPSVLAGTRLVVSPWGSDVIRSQPESTESRLRKRDILQAADQVTCLSEMLRRETLAYCDLDEMRVQTVYWGIDLKQFRRETATVEEPVIGFFKHLMPIYGPDVLLRAFAEVCRELPGAQLIMVGGGEMESELHRLAHDLRVDQRVQWCGKVDHAAIRQLYERCAATTMPTMVPESLGVSALESQALNVPVVGSRIGGIPESIADGETGLLVSPGDHQELAGALVSLLRDQQRRTEMGLAGRRYVEKYFDWQTTLKTTLAVYRSLLGGTEESPPAARPPALVPSGQSSR